MLQGCFDGFANCIRQIIVVPNLFLACFELNNMGYTLARQHAYRNAQPTSHETFLLPSLGELELKSLCMIAHQLLFSSEPDFLGISLTEVSSFTVVSYLSEPAEYRRYFLAFCRQVFEREAPKKLCLFCRLPPLQTTDTTRKRQDSEGFELGTVSRHLTR